MGNTMPTMHAKSPKEFSGLAVVLEPFLVQWEEIVQSKAKEGSEFTQLVHLDLVVLSEVYCLNSIELVWDVLEMLSFKNLPEIDQAHEAACFCFPVEHTLSYLLEKFGCAVEKLAGEDATAFKKTKILLADFGLAWSADETGFPLVMDLTFAKTRHNKKISVVYNKLCEFTEAFAGQRFHLDVYLRYLFFFGMSASIEDLDRSFWKLTRPGLHLTGRRSPLDTAWWTM
ncbi:hypothetical protein DSO57_1001066 [Entomophthora muscae]|uniref:Uncharacterized protein n=1 Tax=Entomophthora muscae TaxID=34485 RepID=A0ACC2RP23_9FUNG|nr:hypothetical protein DSO57_1001066 [Entomophthora muscae]